MTAQHEPGIPVPKALRFDGDDEIGVPSPTRPASGRRAAMVTPWGGITDVTRQMARDINGVDAGGRPAVFDEIEEHRRWVEAGQPAEPITGRTPMIVDDDFAWHWNPGVQVVVHSSDLADFADLAAALRRVLEEAVERFAAAFGGIAGGVIDPSPACPSIGAGIVDPSAITAALNAGATRPADPFTLAPFEPPAMPDLGDSFAELSVQAKAQMALQGVGGHGPQPRQRAPRSLPAKGRRR